MKNMILLDLRCEKIRNLGFNDKVKDNVDHKVIIT